MVFVTWNCGGAETNKSPIVETKFRCSYVCYRMFHYVKTVKMTFFFQTRFKMKKFLLFTFCFVFLKNVCYCKLKVSFNNKDEYSEYAHEEFILEAFKSNGFKITDGIDYNLLFTTGPNEEYRSVSAFDTMKLHNHCYLYLAAGQKCMLSEYINWLKTRGGPFETLEIAKETILNHNHRKTEIKQMLIESGEIWLSKACSSSRSRGMELLFPGSKEMDEYDATVSHLSNQTKS